MTKTNYDGKLAMNVWLTVKLVNFCNNDIFMIE